MQTRVYVLLEYIDLGMTLDLVWYLLETYDCYCCSSLRPFVGKIICRLLCLGCFRLGLGLCLCLARGQAKRTSVGEFDKGKIVNYLLLISLYLFYIFLFITMVLYLF